MERIALASSDHVTDFGHIIKSAKVKYPILDANSKHCYYDVMVP